LPEEHAFRVTITAMANKKRVETIRVIAGLFWALKVHILQIMLNGNFLASPVYLNRSLIDFQLIKFEFDLNLTL
jgi:hypothetical protein